MLALPAAPRAAQPDMDAPIEGKRVALLIGNSAYPPANWPPLANAAGDVRHVAELLGDPARGAARFETELVVNGTRADILAALQRFAAKARTADIALVYYAGHGFEFNLDNYIVPVDGPARADEDSVSDRYINMSDIVRAAGASGFSLFFLDACRVPGPVVALSGNPKGDRAQLFGALNAPNSVVFYSTAMGRPAYDGIEPDPTISPFAAALSKGVSIPGLDIPYVFSRVRDAVTRQTADYDPRQVPQFAGSWSRPFYFLPASATTPIAGKPVAPARLSISLETLSTVDEPVIVTRLLEQHKPAELIAMAEGGDPLALYLVGYMHEFGVGVPRDLAAARRWLERAAATGHPAGQLEYGYFLAQHGAGPEDRARALDLYRAAAGQNYAKAKTHLASALANGSFGPPDWAGALRLYHEAAALGHPNAMYALAMLGERNQQVAALEAVARAGNPDGHNWLCALAVAGSFEHCLEAANAGFADARARVALMYANGQGTAAAPERARFWARLAASQPDLAPMLRTATARLVAAP